MYKQLTFEQRHYINISRKNDKSMRTIAKDLNVSHTTITREISRRNSANEAIILIKPMVLDIKLRLSL